MRKSTHNCHRFDPETVYRETFYDVYRKTCARCKSNYVRKGKGWNMKNRDALGDIASRFLHPAHRQAAVGWVTGGVISWDDLIKIVSQNMAQIRPHAPEDPWQSLSLGEVKIWWSTQYRR